MLPGVRPREFPALLRAFAMPALPARAACGGTELTPDLAFNTAVSFLSNTSWQAYSGETTLSYLTQMVGVGVQSFTSAAAGMAVAMALIRAFLRERSARLGNFWWT